MNTIELARSLYRLRTEHGMTVDDLAQAMELPAEEVIAWECAKKSPSMAQSDALARLYGISLSDLVRPPQTEAKAEAPAPEEDTDETAVPPEDEDVPAVAEPAPKRRVRFWEVAVIVAMVAVMAAGAVILVISEL